MFKDSALIAETAKLKRFAMRLTRNNSDADDLVQSTCLRALEKADYFEDGSNLFNWTSKIMYNLFVSAYRRKTKFESLYDPLPYLEKRFVDPDQEMLLQVSEVGSMLMQITKDQRRILILVCAEGRSYAEVASILGIPIGTVRSRLSRAREQLKLRMEKSAKSKNSTNALTVPACIPARKLKRKTIH